MPTPPDLEDFAASLPKTPPLPKTPKAPAQQQFVPPGPADVERLVDTCIRGLLSSECSPNDRKLAFRAMATATGNDLVVTAWTVFSHMMTALALVGLFLLAVKATAFGKRPTGMTYLQFTPGFCGSVSFVAGVLTIVFRRRPEILLPILTGTIGVLGAVSLAVHL